MAWRYLPRTKIGDIEDQIHQLLLPDQVRHFTVMSQQVDHRLSMLPSKNINHRDINIIKHISSIKVLGTAQITK